MLLPILGHASLPESILLDGEKYLKAKQNDMGNHKYAEYILPDESLNDWSKKLAIHQFLTNEAPKTFADNRFSPSTVTLIDGDPNQVLQTYDTMNTVYYGDVAIYMQNVWRYKKYSMGKGIMAIEYAQRNVMADGATEPSIQPISHGTIDAVLSLPIDRYQF